MEFRIQNYAIRFISDPQLKVELVYAIAVIYNSLVYIKLLMDRGYQNLSRSHIKIKIKRKLAPGPWILHIIDHENSKGMTNAHTISLNLFQYRSYNWEQTQWLYIFLPVHKFHHVKLTFSKLVPFTTVSHISKFTNKLLNYCRYTFVGGGHNSRFVCSENIHF